METKNITHSIFWSAIDVILRQGVQFAVLMIMARLLSPEDFGTIALATLFVALATVFVDGGFSAALIQKQDTSLVDESTVFYFNLLMALCVALGLCVAAPWIAAVFDKPVLRFLVWTMALNVLINAFGAIHTTLLTKALNFKLIAKTGGIASLLSALLALILAFNGFGIWSLVAQTLLSSLVSVSLLWWWHDWRPARRFCLDSLRNFFRYGGYLMIIGAIDALHSNLYAFLIGKYYSVREVGFYDRAQKTQLLPVSFLMLIINRIAFSSFSAAADDITKLARGFRKAQRLVMLINIPLAVMMIVLAEPIILLLFGETWRDSAQILQVLGGDALLWPVHMLNINVLKAQGRSDLFFKIMLIKKIVAMSLIVACSFQGIIAIAWAQVIASIFSFGVNAYYSKVFLDYGPLKQLWDLLPCLLIAAVMGLLMHEIVQSLFLPDYQVSIVAVLTGGTFYLGACYLLRVQALKDISGLFAKRAI